jgi:hypothetical protein
MTYLDGVNTMEIIGGLPIYSPPLVRGRSSVRSRPAAPFFQRLSNGFGRDKHLECTSETPAAPADPCKIRGASPARDILDIAAGAEQLALTLKWAGKGLSDAWEHDIDPPRARVVALRTLQRAQADLTMLIADLDGLEIEPESRPAEIL